MRPSRREFVKWVTASGIALSLSRLAVAQPTSRRCRDGRNGIRPRTAAGRVDGVAKVTGAKLYASDYRANDLPGWPTTTSHAMLVRAPDATHVYTGMDLARLAGAMKPAVVVTADDLDKAGTRVPEFYAGDLFCPVGKTPLYMGQPVALLILETFDAFDQARLALRDGTFVKFGEETGPSCCRTTAHTALRASPARRPMRPTSIRPFRKAGSARANSRTPRCRSGRRSPRRRRRPTPRPASTARRSAPSSPAKDPGLLVLDRDVRDPVGRPDVPRAGMRPRLVRQEGQQARAGARRAVALRGGGVDRASARQGEVQAGAHQCAVRLCGRRLRRARPHALRALCGARRDVLSRQAGAARARPLPAVPGAASNAMRSRCSRASASTARRERSAPSRPIMCSTAAASPTSRPTSRRPRRPRRSASTTCRRSTSPRWRCIRAASPRARCAATARCRR